RGNPNRGSRGAGPGGRRIDRPPGADALRRHPFRAFRESGRFHDAARANPFSRRFRMTEVLEAPLVSAAPELDCFAPVYPLPRLELVSGHGAWVKDAEGRAYLDFVSGIAVNALGHTPSGFAQAIARQLKQLGQVSNLFGHAPGLELARE